MIYSMLEIQMRDAIANPTNLYTDGSINWDFVDADAYAECRSFWKDDADFYESFDEIANTIIAEHIEEATAEFQLELDLGV
jgi:hypothetical protein